MPPKPRPIPERFWKHVDKRGPDECWPWTGSRLQRGYGMLRNFTAKRWLRATHISLELDGRPLPPGMLALHTCDNPPCVNPAHLFIGTQSDNMADMHAKGRHKVLWTAEQRANLSNGQRAGWATQPSRISARSRRNTPDAA